MSIADLDRNDSRELRADFDLNRRFNHGREFVRAGFGGTLVRRAIRRHRIRRSPSFKRVVRIAGMMGQAPDHSLPQQHKEWSELLAAYRFLHNAKTTPDRIQSVHRASVRQDCQTRSLVLALQDTSELDFTGRVVDGLGPIGNGNGQGLLQHSTLAMDPRGRLLGVLHQIWRLRVPAPEGETRAQRLQRPRESDFWPDSVHAVGSLGTATRIIHVTDRGGDGFGTLTACQAQDNVGFLIRAQHDRRVNGGTDKLWSFMEKQPVTGHRDVPIEYRAGHERRIARVSIRFAQVRLDPPKQDPRFKEPIDVWAVYALEESAPDDVEPIEWMLLTSEAVNTPADAGARLDWYGLRWMVEEFHKAEKSGCRLERVQLKTAAAITNWAALVAVMAVRLIQLRDMAQEAVSDETDDTSSPAHKPETLRTVVPRSWVLVVAKLAKCDWIELTPHRFWLTLAKRGGYLARSNDGPPGWSAIWRGWYDIMLMVQGFELLGQAEEDK